MTHSQTHLLARSFFRRPLAPDQLTLQCAFFSCVIPGVMSLWVFPAIRAVTSYPGAYTSHRRPIFSHRHLLYPTFSSSVCERARCPSVCVCGLKNSESPLPKTCSRQPLLLEKVCACELMCGGKVWRSRGSC